MAKKFTIPKLKSYPLESGKDWYVWFRYEGGNPIRISEGINKNKQAIAAVKSLDFQDENIKDFEPFHITLILEEMCTLSKNTANYYNMHIEGFVRFFNMLKEKFIVKSTYK
ncbi:hypothetical protein MHJ94_02750 [Chryseobacterium taklimakanense]|uniref:hypothetical protein n=1 Tax=Chryseobacterium taklimakanense TaxID=536441 RepID=UPI001EF58971|nr:hypothetical protein [Chryseobacterium taklimakanense]MCG7280211.1 hypothetical protein [Chryseobacterium taklimakanense]